MFNLFALRFVALFAYMFTFQTRNDDILEIYGALNGGYGLYYYRLMQYEGFLLQNGVPANPPEENTEDEVFPTVTLPSGTVVTGKHHEKTRTFHNIPYAEPPVGDLR